MRSRGSSNVARLYKSSHVFRTCFWDTYEKTKANKSYNIGEIEDEEPPIYKYSEELLSFFPIYKMRFQLTQMFQNIFNNPEENHEVSNECLPTVSTNLQIYKSTNLGVEAFK